MGANTVGDVKKVISSKKAKYRDVNRQELRLEPKGKALKDDQTLSSLGLNTGALLYFKVPITFVFSLIILENLDFHCHNHVFDKQKIGAFQ